MPRVLGLILIFILSLGVAAWFARRAQQARDQVPRNTFRPKRRGQTSHSSETLDEAAPFVMTREDAEAISDAFTGARINPQRSVWRCMGCQSMYHETSIRALKKESGRSCMNCDSHDQRAVQFDTAL
jgi:hypothetical protein